MSMCMHVQACVGSGGVLVEPGASTWLVVPCFSRAHLSTHWYKAAWAGKRDAFSTGAPGGERQAAGSFHPTAGEPRSCLSDFDAMGAQTLSKDLTILGCLALKVCTGVNMLAPGWELAEECCPGPLQRRISNCGWTAQHSGHIPSKYGTWPERLSQAGGCEKWHVPSAHCGHPLGSLRSWHWPRHSGRRGVIALSWMSSKLIFLLFERPCLENEQISCRVGTNTGKTRIHQRTCI